MSRRAAAAPRQTGDVQEKVSIGGRLDNRTDGKAVASKHVLMRVGVVALGALCGTRCLLPQEDTVLSELILRNHPPRIVEETAQVNQSARRTLTFGNDPGCQLQFQAAVEDPDIDDPVTFRWYVDYEPLLADAGVPQNDRHLALVQDTLVPSGQALRGTVTLTRFTENNPRFAAGNHNVTLMIFDGRLAPEQGPGTTPDPDPATGDPSYSTTFDWFVTIENGPCLPQ